jgi:hypothetical protein
VIEPDDGVVAPVARLGREQPYILMGIPAQRGALRRLGRPGLSTGCCARCPASASASSPTARNTPGRPMPATALLIAAVAAIALAAAAVAVRRRCAGWR